LHDVEQSLEVSPDLLRLASGPILRALHYQVINDAVTAKNARGFFEHRGYRATA
jgi:hypothetical protein